MARPLRSPCVAIHALGCKLNQAELEELARQLASRGLTIVGPRENADVYVLNTCTVTAEADRKVRQWLRSARRRNPGALVIAAGCSVETEREQLSRLADIVLDNSSKHTLPDVVEEYFREASRPAPRPATAGGWRPRSRATVKVQEGCSMPCAYCVIPLVRGAERSLSVGQVVSAVEDRVREGHFEIVLTGTRVGAYGADGLSLAGLVERVLGVAGLRRLRLSSLQPHELTPDLLALWSDPRLCPQVHMSLQSGSAAVLQRMRRAYSPARFLAALAMLRTAVPDVAITTDVIAGFPGETDGEFRETASFCEEARFSRLHVFPFSPRPRTAAAEMDSIVPVGVVRDRIARLKQVADRCRTSWESSCVGATRQVLWEEETAVGSGVYAGTTEDYIRVYGRAEDMSVTGIDRVLLDRIEDGRVWVRSVR